MELLKIILNSWQFNVTAAVIAAVLYVQYYKLAVKDTPREGVSTVILESFGALAMLLLMPFFAFKFSLTWPIAILFIFANVFYTLNDRIKTRVRKNLEVSVFSIIDQLSKVFLIIYGIILFHDPLIAAKLIGGALIILGNVALFWHKGRFVVNKYVWLSALASLLLATALVIDVDISRHFNLPFYVLLTFLIPAVFNYALERCSFREVVRELSSERRKYYIISGLVSGPTVFFSIRALQLGQVAFIAPLLATTVLVNVLVASIFQGERSRLWRKIAVAVVIIVGVYLTVA